MFSCLHKSRVTFNHHKKYKHLQAHNLVSYLPPCCVCSLVILVCIFDATWGAFVCDPSQFHSSACLTSQPDLRRSAGQLLLQFYNGETADPWTTSLPWAATHMPGDLVLSARTEALEACRAAAGIQRGLNRHRCLACGSGRCLRPIEALGTQMQLVARQCTRAALGA